MSHDDDDGVSLDRRGEHGGGGGGHGGGSERWLITYADMITLLMVFFVVMFASAETQKEKLMALSDSIKKAMNIQALSASESTGSSILSRPAGPPNTSVSEAIDRAAKALGLEKGISVSADERGTVISLVDAFFFDSGASTIKGSAKPLLAEVAKFVGATNVTIHVEGHTDDREIHHPLIPSNWELSALRAGEVIRFFQKTAGIQNDRMVLVGYGPTRPLVPNTSEANRARNRRVDIVLVNAVIQNKKKKDEGPTTLNLLGGAGKPREDTSRPRASEELPKPVSDKPEKPPADQHGNRHEPPKAEGNHGGGH